jgi:hypothetical protein
MEEEGIANPEIAWSHFERLHPPPAPSMPGSAFGGPNFFMPQTDKDDGGLMGALHKSRGQDDSAVDKVVRDALNEMRGVQRR